jgi:NAD(P)-dependent dehydrogenase (short-subunit alcohol dehydrogenase family)
MKDSGESIRRPDLSGLRALVTGGNRGIGKAIALALASSGARVAICGRNEKTLAATADLLNAATPGAFCQPADVRSEEEQRALFNEIRERFGGLDICVPNAGEATLATVLDTSLADWHRDIGTNLTGVFLTCREALKMMKDQGSGWILPIVSQAGKRAFLLRAAYCASKWGALGFTKCLALEAAQYNVRVTAICPASVATDFQKDNPRGTDWMMEADDVAACVLYLLGLSDRVEIEEIVLKTRKKSGK